MKIGKLAGRCVIRTCIRLRGNGGFGMNELLGIAAALILAAFIIIPGLQTFANSVMTGLQTWWSGTVLTEIFPPN
ncbi:MAG: hypothetical protein FIA99_10415 [Ruminiclostridium sp.]|nr:hypothetical protein [Ruminiclostridium sp.]